VEPAHDDRDAAPPVLARDLVRAPRRVGLDGHRDQIRGRVEGHALHAVVEEADLDVLRRQPGDDRVGQGLHLPGPEEALPGAATHGGVDQREPERPHRASAEAGARASRPTIQSQL